MLCEFDSDIDKLFHLICEIQDGGGGGGGEGEADWRGQGVRWGSGCCRSNSPPVGAGGHSLSGETPPPGSTDFYGQSLSQAVAVLLQSANIGCFCLYHLLQGELMCDAQSKTCWRLKLYSASNYI